MGRQEIILKGIETRTLVGVEIGPLDKPLVRKGHGTVYYVDHCDTDTLKARWSTDSNVDISALHVDAVWGNMSLRDALLTAAGADINNWPGVDYMVASHVVEHVPDLVSWLREAREILKPRGTLRLAVPDKRYTFDYLRRTTNFTEIAAAFVRKRRTPSASRVLDFTLNMVHIDCGAAWRGEIDKQKLQHGYTHESALTLARDAEENGTYHDVHCWVFTPQSFVKLMAKMAHYGLMEFGCDWLVPTERNTFEFFVSMTPAENHVEAEGSWKRIAETLASKGSLKDSKIKSESQNKLRRLFFR